MEAQILDCTIRDGSCEVEFQFTAQDVAVLAAGLDQAGVAFIEAGHGFAMGTNSIVKDPRLLAQVGCDMTAALDDHEYFKVIRPLVKKAKIGALFGPGYMGMGDEWIHMAADCGLDFLRMGTFSDREGPEKRALGHDRAALQQGIRVAKDRKLLVFIQLMQTYAQTQEQISEAAKNLVGYGADWIYVVDSAGTMVPDQVARYVETVLKSVNTQVGFHSHNNTQTALSNCLAAVDAGATMVDGSLQGVGRATGNASTEGLLALLRYRRNMETKLDQDLIFNLGRNVARPWVKGGFDPTHVLSGIGRIHSDRLHTIRTAAKAKGFGIDDVCVEVGRHFEQQNLTQRWTPETAANACTAIAEQRKPQKKTYETAELAKSLAEADSNLPDLGAMLKQLKVHAIRDRLKTMLVFVRPSMWPLAGPSIVTRGGWAIGAMPTERYDLSSFEHHEWLHQICADDQLPHAESTVAVRTVSLSSITAEAATMRSQVAVSLVACDDKELARAVSGRLVRGECVVLEPGQPAPNRDFAAVYVQGKSGSKVLEELRARFRPGMTVQLLGGELLSAELTDALRKTDLRLPDVWSMLIAFATLDDRAAVVAGDSAVEPTDRPYQIVAGSGEIMDSRSTTVLGRWAPFAAKTIRDRLSIRAIKDLYEKRIARIFGTST